MSQCPILLAAFYLSLFATIFLQLHYLLRCCYLFSTICYLFAIRHAVNIIYPNHIFQLYRTISCLLSEPLSPIFYPLYFPCYITLTSISTNHSHTISIFPYSLSAIKLYHPIFHSIISHNMHYHYPLYYLPTLYPILYPAAHIISAIALSNYIQSKL